MVNTNDSTNNDVSPSSFTTTPQLTINYEATKDLDSSNAFEGPEKLLEVWFCPSPDSLPPGTHPEGLKHVSSETWEDMLQLVNCKVLSTVKSEHIDAYLLSESSLLVTINKIIIKTCGTTNLLVSLSRVLEIARTVGFPRLDGDFDPGLPGTATPWRVFYSRKNFAFPERQPGVHKSWKEEVSFLDRWFQGNSSSYMIGNILADHWYLYITKPNTLLTPPATPPEEPDVKDLDILSDQVEGPCRRSSFNFQDFTLEVLMTELRNPDQFFADHAMAAAKVQYADCTDQVPEMFNDGRISEGHALGEIVAQKCGLAAIYPPSQFPNVKMDSYIFQPCGFSSNAVIPAADGQGTAHYFTVHVTPEQKTFASFETNVPTGKGTADIIEQVVRIFKPARFSVTLFEAKESFEDEAEPRKDKRIQAIRGYRKVDQSIHDIDGYGLQFQYYHLDDRFS